MIWEIIKKGYCFPVLALSAALLLYMLIPFNSVTTGHNNTASGHQANKLDSTGNSYKADIFVRGPVKGTGGQRINLTLTLTELSDSSKLGSALVLLPDLHGAEGFSNYRINTEDSGASGEKKWQSRIIEQNGRHYINLRARGESDYLTGGESVSVTFSASTPAASRAGAYEFQTRAWTDNRSRDSMRTDPQTGKAENVNIMASGYSDPVIHVEVPENTGNESNQYNTDRASGLRTELQAEGTGFNTLAFSTTNSAAFLTTLELPAVHSFTTTYHEPSDNDSWRRSVVVEDETADLLQGYASGWQGYYHRVASPGKNETYHSFIVMLESQLGLENEDLDGLSESELRELAHREDIDYYFTELTALTEQVWFAAVALEPGEKGILVKEIDSSYGTTDYIFDEDGELWTERRGYQGSAEGFGFVQDGDGYRIERGIDYPGSYIDLGQVADASKGKVIRYIDISSPYSNSFLRENMIVSGSGKVDEILGNVNIEPGRYIDWPGSASFSDDWDLWIFSDGSSRSKAFDSPFFDPAPGGNGGMGGRSDSSKGSDVDSATRDASAQEGADTDQVASSPKSSEEREDEIVLPPEKSVAAGNADDADEFDPAGEYVLDFSVDTEQGTDYSSIIVVSVIALTISLAILAILVVLIRGANTSGRKLS